MGHCHRGTASFPDETHQHAEAANFNRVRRANTQRVQALLDLAESPSAACDVIVLQEWWGLVPHIGRVVDRFAAAGVTALAPDLYHGRIARAPDDAERLMMSTRVEDAGRDIRSAMRGLSLQAMSSNLELLQGAVASAPNGVETPTLKEYSTASG